MGNNNSTPTIPAITTRSEAQHLGHKVSIFGDTDTILWMDGEQRLTCRDLHGFVITDLQVPPRFQRYSDGGLAMRIRGAPDEYFFLSGKRMYRLHFPITGYTIDQFYCKVAIDEKCRIFRHDGLIYLDGGRRKRELDWELTLLDSEWQILKTLVLPNTCYKVIGFTHNEHGACEIIFTCQEGLSYYNISTGIVHLYSLPRYARNYNRMYTILDQLAFSAPVTREVNTEDVIYERRHSRLVPEVIDCEDFPGAGSEDGDNDSSRGSGIRTCRSMPVSADRMNGQFYTNARAISADSQAVPRRTSTEVVRNFGYLISLVKRDEVVMVVADSLNGRQHEVLMSTEKGDGAVYAIAVSNNRTLFMYTATEIITWKVQT